MKLAIIGAGAMGTALMNGILKAGLIEPKDIIITDICKDVMEASAKETHVQTSEYNRVAVKDAQIILLAVKPGIISHVLEDIKSVLTPEQLVVSIAAGVQIKTIEGILPQNPIIRVMPNTPCLIGRGAIGISGGSRVSDELLERTARLFAVVGEVVLVAEHLLDSVTGLSGSGPAYVFTIIEALSDGGVAAGLPRDVSTKLAVETIIGSAFMLLETGKHPAQLRDMVTSPGGTTITGLRVLEDRGIRSALIEAVIAATEKSRSLGE